MLARGASTLKKFLLMLALCAAVPAHADFDPIYNVCRGTDAKCYHDWARNAREGNRVLIYSRTVGFRHANLGPPLAAGLNPPLSADHVVQNTLKSWLEQEGITADWTEDPALLDKLNKYKAVIFASTNGAALANSDTAKTALRQYLRAGGGFVGIHNAFGTEYNWPWYEGLLGNANFYDHGELQDGTVQIVSGSDPSTLGLPKSWPFRDEWYNLEPFPTRVKFLATVDESSLATHKSIHPGHGKFHPVAWCQYYDGGRAWLTTLGHESGAFTDNSAFPGQPPFKALIVNGIKSAMGLTAFCASRPSSANAHPTP
jgi:type 1 glutamine amidotransferase